MTKVVSDIEYLDIVDDLSSEYIEDKLENKYGSIIRWAVISVENEQLKICFTYEKDEN